MSGGVRARRTGSPPLGYSGAAPRIRNDHSMDADARREAASRGFLPSSKSRHSSGGLNMIRGEWMMLGIVVVVACFVRFWNIAAPNSVVFDEVHFGKFAGKYIKTKYFMDVHPPLAKLLITLAGFVSGYDGHFDFKDIGKVYDDRVPYVAMRSLPALLGVATVPLSYLTLRALDCRATTALLASFFITFENGMITQSRHILLDSPLIFFTALTIFLWVGFCNEDRHAPFTPSWWRWLILSGLSLGAVLSCKWVGLFTTATVGISTLFQLWALLGDLKVPAKTFVRHFVARALCLIVIPILFYMTMFQIHFMILDTTGDGDGFMSSEFQHTLRGRGMSDTFAEIGFGSTVSIRHVNTQGGYLHSHAHNYPGGSKQQQITLYPHRDSNNEWLFVNASAPMDDRSWENPPLTDVKHGMKVRFVHTTTEKRLHSHDVRPPISDVDFQNEVSAYGFPGFAGDANDDWIVEIEKGDSRDKKSSKHLRTLRTQFRLKHVLSGCYLFSHKVKLPDWGFEQQEVTCNKNAVRANSLWFVETANHPALPADADRVNYKKPGFLKKFWELQGVMWTTNAGLTDRHTYDSRPDSWPRMRRGINFWVKDHKHIYLIGNPWVWWLGTASVVAYTSVRAFLILRAKRGYRDFDSTKVVKYDTLCGFLFMGWALHYFPFFLMGRQLFLHHYLPALYFSILLFCSVFDLVTSTLKPKVRLQVAFVLVVVAIWNWQHFAPLVYGSPWTKAECHNAKWLKTWDFSCNEYFDDYSKYTPVAAVDGTPIHSDVPVAQGDPVNNDKQQNQQQAAKADTTKSAAHGQPEPGRDIFADKDKIEDIKSEQRKPAAVEPEAPVEGKAFEDEKKAKAAEERPTDAEEAKVISTAAPKVAEEESAVVEPPSPVEPPAPEPVIDNEAVDPVVPVVEDAAADGKKAEGPLVQDEAVAEDVAKELYPEA